MSSKHYHRRWRRMSDFMCREMMYDYVLGQLDADRSEAVANFLAISREAREDKQDLEYGLQYCELMSHSEISPQLAERLAGGNEQRAKWGAYFYWRNWPAPVRWSAESIVIAAVFAFVTSMVPWQRLKLIVPHDRSPQILAKIEQLFQTTATPTDSQNLADSRLSESEAGQHSEGQEVDGGPEVSINQSAHGDNEATINEIAQQDHLARPMTAVEGQEESPLHTVAPPPMVTPTKSQPLAVGAVTTSIMTQAPVAEMVDTETRGYIYRAYMNLANVDEVSSEIANVIRGLGGKKAGSVELGWRKPNGSYYHFTLPESNYGKLEEALKTYGLVRIYKERHKRVMPSGQIRLILWVEEVKPNPDQPNEAANVATEPPRTAPDEQPAQQPIESDDPDSTP